MVLHRHGSIEQHHHSIAGEVLDRSIVLDDEAAKFGVILAQYAHHLLGLRRFGEAGEAAQIDVHHRNLRATRLERVVRLTGHDQVADLRREKSRKPGIPPDLRYLLGDPRFERCIPFGKLCRLFLHLSVLVLDLGIEAFEYSILLDHELVRFLGSLLCLDKLPFSLLLLGDIRHHRDRAAAPRPDGGGCEAIARPGVWSSKLLPDGLRRLSTRSATRASTSPVP